MFKIEIEGQEYIYNTTEELWADMQTKFSDVFKYTFQLYHMENGEWVEGLL